MALMVSGDQDLDGFGSWISKGLKAVGGVGSAVIGGATGAAVEGGIRAGKKALGIGGGRRRAAPAPVPVELPPPPVQRRRRPTPLYKRVEVVVPAVMAVFGLGYLFTRKSKRGA